MKSKKPSPPRYWFPAKTSGWGWGLPSRWEGWVVVWGHLALLVALIRFLPADRHANRFWAGVGTLIASLMAICWWKGEPPRWRLPMVVARLRGNVVDGMFDGPGSASRSTRDEHGKGRARPAADQSDV